MKKSKQSPKTRVWQKKLYKSKTQRMFFEGISSSEYRGAGYYREELDSWTVEVRLLDHSIKNNLVLFDRKYFKFEDHEAAIEYYENFENEFKEWCGFLNSVTREKEFVEVIEE